MKNKKGSHVGIVISFAIFLLFLVFLYSVIEPVTKIEKDKQTLLDFLETELSEKFSDDLTTVTITLNESIQGACISIPHVEAVKELNSTVKDSGNNIIESSSTYNEISIENIVAGQKEIIKIYYSNESFNTGILAGGSCSQLTSQNYSIEFVKTKKDIFESKVSKLINNYTLDYEGLKNELNVPPGSEFGFGITLSNGSKRITTDNIPENLNVYSTEKPVQYIDRNASIHPGFIDVRVW